MGIHHSVIGRLMQCLQATEMVDERPRFHRPRKTTPRDNMLVARLVRRNRFTTSARIRDELNCWGLVSVRTINRSLNEQRLCRRRHIKRRNCHYVIGGLDGIGDLTISVGIFVIGNEFIVQAKVEFNCTPWMVPFEYGKHYIS